MVSQSFSFVTYMYFLLGMVGEDTTALLQGVSLQEVVSKRMENGSVNAYAVFPLHWLRPAHENSFSLLVTPVSPAVRACGLCKNSHCKKEFALRRFSSRCFKTCDDCMVSVIHLFRTSISCWLYMEWLRRGLFETVQTW